jgi:hypothetical protein
MGVPPFMYVAQKELNIICKNNSWYSHKITIKMSELIKKYHAVSDKQWLP